jgi:hemerythrin superfamily protein
MTKGQNIVELVLRDHQRAGALLAQLEATSDADLEEYFCHLREVLVRHEVAEELVVYPAFRDHVSGAAPIADACIAEQSEAEEALATLEKTDTTSDSFRTQLVELRQAVLAHAKHEERDVLPALERNIDPQQLGELGDRYDKALESAPTHPHPHAPDTPPGNTLLGPIAALIDRVRDAMRDA